jgi:hypothetical protein
MKATLLELKLNLSNKKNDDLCTEIENLSSQITIMNEKLRNRESKSRNSPEIKKDNSGQTIDKLS